MIKGSSPYVPSIRDDPGRFDEIRDFCSAFTLVRYGEDAARLRENATGLVLGPRDSRLPRLGVYPSELRGIRHHASHALRGDFRPGRTLTLSPERYNEWDDHAIAVLDHTGPYLAAYVNKQTARVVGGLMSEGIAFGALSLRNTEAGVTPIGISLLIAPSAIIEGLHAARRTSA